MNDRHAAPADSAPVLIVAPTARELAGCLRSCKARRLGRRGATRLWSGRRDERSVLLAATGDGARSAERGLNELLDSAAVSLVVVAGVAGALSPDLPLGSLLVAAEVRDGANAVPPPDPTALDRLRGLGSLRPGTLCSASRIAVTAAQKAALWAELGRPEAAAVDLESAAYARAAHTHGLPYLAIRVISDRADEDLPLDFNRCRDRLGRVAPGRVLVRALLAPGSLPGLVELRRRVGAASDALGDLVPEVAA